jgi:hypothetical protein
MAIVTLPKKPCPGFPLFPHQRGYWAKKILGKTHYFGRIEDGWQAAEDPYNRQREDVHAGREPRDHDERLTVKDLYVYLAVGELRVANGEIGEISWDDSFKTAKLFSGFIGKTWAVE